MAEDEPLWKRYAAARLQFDAILLVASEYTKGEFSRRKGLYYSIHRRLKEIELEILSCNQALEKLKRKNGKIAIFSVITFFVLAFVLSVVSSNAQNLLLLMLLIGSVAAFMSLSVRIEISSALGRLERFEQERNALLMRLDDIGLRSNIFLAGRDNWFWMNQDMQVSDLTDDNRQRLESFYFSLDKAILWELGVDLRNVKGVLIGD